MGPGSIISLNFLVLGLLKSALLHRSLCYNMEWSNGSELLTKRTSERNDDGLLQGRASASRGGNGVLGVIKTEKYSREVKRSESFCLETSSLFDFGWRLVGGWVEVSGRMGGG
jgi:hypothetical protein